MVAASRFEFDALRAAARCFAASSQPRSAFQCAGRACASSLAAYFQNRRRWSCGRRQLIPQAVCAIIPTLMSRGVFIGLVVMMSILRAAFAENPQMVDI